MEQTFDDFINSGNFKLILPNTSSRKKKFAKVYCFLVI